MKINRISFSIATLLGLGSLATLGIVASPKANSSQPVNAAEDYYSGINANADPASLLDSLKSLVQKNYNSLGYDGLLTAYKTTDKRADGYLNDYYSNITNYVIGGSKQNAQYKKEGDSYNREHGIPQSWWGGGTSKQGCDAFIVWPTDGYINNMRSSFPFGEVGTISRSSANQFSKLGSSKIEGYSGTVFEPNDKWKGDFARMYFYAVCKWNTTSWTGNDAPTTFLTSRTSPNFGLTNYGIKLFTKWHAQDPVDQWELDRNDHVQALQYNRNPFIDHPEWATKIWGGNYITKEIKTLTVSGSLTKTTYTEGQKFDPTGLKVTATYEDNTTADVTDSVSWSPSTLTAGTTFVTGTVNGKTVTVSGITVNPAKAVSISVSETNVNLPLNGVFSFTGKVTATLDNGLTKDVTSNCTFSGYDLTKSGAQTVTVTYGELTTTYNITIKEILAGEGYKIEFSNNSSDGSTVLSESAIKSHISSGAEYIASISNIAKVYEGQTGLKMGSGSGSGTLTLNLNASGKQNIKGIKVTAKKYGSDASSLSVTTNLNSTAVTYSPTDTLEAQDIDVTGELTTISFATQKRVYLSSIEVISGDGTTTYTHVTDITLDKSTAELEAGKTVTLTPTVLPADANNKKVSWSSNNERVATVNNGVVSGLSKGTATITATTQDGNLTATCVVTVTSSDVSVTGVTLDKATFEGKVGQTIQLTATVTPTNATNKNVTWVSSNASVATVSSTGLVTLVAEGTAEISVKTIDGNFTAKCAITVSKDAVNPPVENSNNGCGGSIITSSIIISAVSLLALSFLIVKKQLNKKHE